MPEAAIYESKPPPPEELHDNVDGLAPADAFDPFIEALKVGMDRTQFRQNLALTPEERLQKFLGFARLAGELRAAGDRAREQNPAWGLGGHGS